MSLLGPRSIFKFKVDGCSDGRPNFLLPATSRLLVQMLAELLQKLRLLLGVPDTLLFDRLGAGLRSLDRFNASSFLLVFDRLWLRLILIGLGHRKGKIVELRDASNEVVSQERMREETRRGEAGAQGGAKPPPHPLHCRSGWIAGEQSGGGFSEHPSQADSLSFASLRLRR